MTLDPFAFFRKLGGNPLVDDMKAAEAETKKYNAQYAAERQKRGNTWNTPGNVQKITPIERGFHLMCERGQVEIVWIADDCLRVRLKTSPGAFEAPFSYAVEKTLWMQVQTEFDESDDAAVIKSASTVCRIHKKPFRLEIETLQGQPICGEASGIQWSNDGSISLGLKLQADEACYGLAERPTSLNLRGKRAILWNHDNNQYERDDDPIYYNIPFYLGAHSGGFYGVFWDNSYRGAVDLGRANPSELKFSAEGGELRYYLFANPDIKKIVSRYTELTGRPKLPPLWSLGYQQCRWSYYPESTVLDIAAQFRKRKIPCDVLYLDIHYMDGYRVFTWDQKSFPDLKGMIDKLHQQGFKVIVILDPGIKIDPNYAVYKSGVERDVFLKYPDGKMARGPVWPGMCHFPDFSKPATREWWVEHSQAIFDLGIDGVWNDMCEPTIFSSSNILTLADAVRHDNEGNGGDHVEHHNVYGMLMGRASSEAFDKYRPNTRPVNIIRAGYAGAQRYAMSWTGDNRSDWDHLALSIPMTLSMGLCGAPITGPDIGGFRGEGEGELFIRWLQAAALMPYFRTHTALDTPQQEPWSYGDKIEALSRETIKLRYRLLPYLYSLFAQASEYGYPIIRPLFMAEPQNPELRSIDDCYLVGDALLVAPILQKGAVSRSVYLPAGQWYDFWTNTGITGGRMITVKAPLERLPLFVRAGTVLPLWPEMDYVGQKDINEITLRVYPGAGETTLYEDAGEGKGYQQGDYRWVYMSTEIDGSKLYVKRRAAGRYQPAYSSIRVEFVLQDEEPDEIKVDRRPAPLWFFDYGLLEFTTSEFTTIELTRVSRPNDPTIVRRPRR